MGLTIEYVEGGGPLDPDSKVMDLYFFFYIICEYRALNLSGGRLNKKDGLTRCGDSHVKDKTS